MFSLDPGLWPGMSPQQLEPRTDRDLWATSAQLYSHPWTAVECPEVSGRVCPIWPHRCPLDLPAPGAPHGPLNADMLMPTATGTSTCMSPTAAFVNKVAKELVSPSMSQR